MLRGHYDGTVITITDDYRVALSTLDRGAITRQLAPTTTLAELERHLRELAELLKGESK